jgi:hypothetical protein
MIASPQSYQLSKDLRALLCVEVGDVVLVEALDLIGVEQLAAEFIEPGRRQRLLWRPGKFVRCLTNTTRTPCESIIDESMRIRLRDGSERFILRKAPDATARDEPQPHTGLVGE